jgi:putative spermidine/putrescine transport system substrate-binding protein
MVALASGAAILPACLSDNPGPSATPTATSGPSPTAVVVPSVAGYEDPARWEGRTLTVSSWGGEYQDAQEQAIFEPFQRLTGAKIETEMTDTSVLRRQVETDEVRWDVSDILMEDVLTLANLGTIEELDYNVIDTGGIDPNIRFDHGIGSAYYSTVLSYVTTRWPNLPAPSGWADFWNVDQYPGERGLHQQAQTTLEFALLADNVPINELYPLDVARAFASLERIRPSVTLWWEQGAQPAQILNSGDIAMVAAWNSRVERVRQQGAPVDIQWRGGALQGDAWVIPKGSKSRDVAMDFINFATRPEVCAAFASLVPFGPVNRGAFDLLPDEIARLMPSYPANMEQQFTIDFEWWFKHQEQVVARFEAWIAEHP